MTLLAAAPLNHQEHRYQRQLTSWLSAHAVSNFRSPKGRNQVSQLPYSREVTETHSFYHLARAVSAVPGERRISASILGTEPRKLPSPLLPGSNPGPLRLRLLRQNRGVQNRPGSDLGVRATGALLRARGASSQSRATHTPAAWPAGTRTSFPNHSLLKVCASSRRKARTRDAGTVLTPAGVSLSIPEHPTKLSQD